jgi:exo-rhamnogalacturonan lyase-like protein
MTTHVGAWSRVPIVLSRRRTSDAIEDPTYEPITLGLPFPPGALADAALLNLRDATDRRLPLQARALERWHDGSVKWALLDFQTQDDTTIYNVGPGPRMPDVKGIELTQTSGGVLVDTGAARFSMLVHRPFPFASVAIDAREVIDRERSGLHVVDGTGRTCRVQIRRVVIDEHGPLRATVLIEGTVASWTRPILRLHARLHFFAGSAAVRCLLTLHNPRAAVHPNGIWELGDRGSVYLKSVELEMALPENGPPADAWCSPELERSLELIAQPLELHQDSSGGERWHSPTHRNRHGVITTKFRGYRMTTGVGSTLGERATPAARLERGKDRIAVTMEHFWQNFPKSLEVSDDRIVLGLFPRQHSDLHEIQGGEQKTHRFTLAFGRDLMSTDAVLWGRLPRIAHSSAAYYCASHAVPYLGPMHLDGMKDYDELIASAVEGPDAFERKREVIDEYGWRNFGDIYADHEALFHNGGEPFVSHYNNQYDAVAGFACQFMRSADVRWFTQMEELATHVVDIDIYHTTRDKSAYNGGLFWHTYHYVPAGLSSHRSYPSAKNVSGGGPSNEHNYASGLRLHHLLTGDAQMLEAAIGLGRWVIAMDDGAATPFAWVASGATGLASATCTGDYHGPGRGVGHSIIVLLDAHRLSGDHAFLEKAEELIHRCVHPDDDVEARKLLDAERRWSYTSLLEALAKYLDYKAERDELDEAYAYARASLLRYARWMVIHEYPFLEKPEILEYPTETWAAQDMRKAEIFLLASRHAPDAERQTFLDRARFFFDYSTSALKQMPTRGRARPVVLLLSHGFMYGYFLEHPGDRAPEPRSDVHDFGSPPPAFIPQKARALERLKPRSTTLFTRLLGLLPTG